MPSSTLLTILGMAAVTLLTRLGGVALMRVVTPSPALERWLAQVPGAVLAALVAPDILKPQLPELLATLVTVVLARRFGNLLVALIGGVLTVWLLRMGLGVTP